MEAFRTRRPRFVKSTTSRRRCASVFMCEANFWGRWFCSRRTIFVKLISPCSCVAHRIRLSVPQPTEWQRIANWIDAARVRVERRTSVRLNQSRLRRSIVKALNPIVRARNSGNVCPDSNMIAAYCLQLPCHGLAIVATKLSFSGGYRLLSKRGRSRLPPTLWPNRPILMSRSLMKAAKPPHVQLVQLKHLPPHQVYRRSYEVQQLSILVQRLFPRLNTSKENKLIKDSNQGFDFYVYSVNFRSGLIRASCRWGTFLFDEKITGSFQLTPGVAKRRITATGAGFIGT
jgi:hypothetical protein